MAIVLVDRMPIERSIEQSCIVKYVHIWFAHVSAGALALTEIIAFRCKPT